MSDELDLEHASFGELLDFLIAGNEPAIGYSGILSELDDHQVMRRRRVWRLGRLARIEEPPGHTRLLAGEDTMWCAADDQFEETWELRDEDRGSDRGQLHDVWLVEPRRYWTSWLSLDPDLVMDSLHRTEFEGRPAWKFTAPEAKGGNASIIIDAEIGLVVEMSRADVGHAVIWSELQVEPTLGPRFFEPGHLTPLARPDAERDPSESERLHAERTILTAVLQAGRDWPLIARLAGSSRDEHRARATIMAHLDIEEWTAQHVMGVQVRQLDRSHQEAIRARLHELERQLDHLEP
ncbi:MULTISPECIES: hypothetical protein [unclassified Nocardioides]|uniref:hypothetical protein n=1 Tax=unclassified Nocardioides TaxID=2615069 RepID=UPI0007035594|nr:MULTISPECIES: hypothetical protein [unclassified Nocardioides]KRC49079.1 hypothetical protein ASE19_19545 [Nocardioides sp. Root79]KRC75480.1 hypothetical protein ASE20_21450 [Nocardioides sp. Root240]